MVAELSPRLVNRQRRHAVDLVGLERFLVRAAREIPPLRESAVVACLVSDPAMRRSNREFRGIDRPTDVLSFPAEDLIEDGRVYLGDILIAVPTAARQAGEAGRTLRRELQSLLLHGYLHLLGYDHEQDGGLMRRFQARLERRLFPRRRSGRR